MLPVHNFYQQQLVCNKKKTVPLLRKLSLISISEGHTSKTIQIKLYKYTLCGLAICQHDVFLGLSGRRWEQRKTSHHILKFAAEVNISQGAVTPKISNHQFVTTVWLQLCCFVCLVPVVYILCLRCVWRQKSIHAQLKCILERITKRIHWRVPPTPHPSAPPTNIFLIYWYPRSMTSL